MRRESRRKNTEDGFRNLIVWSGVVLVIAIIAFGITFAIYSNKVKEDSRVSTLNSGKVAELVPNLQTNNEISASADIGKTVNEMQNSLSNTSNNTINSIANNNVNNVTNNTTVGTSTNVTNTTSKYNNTAKNTTVQAEKQETKKELSFKMPVDGKVSKEFAKEGLIYSETLKEWITHLGVDINAEKTSVVKSAEAGTIKSIKNDPRYGLTVVIEHDDGYKTVYSNLLTAEFVSEGEEVEQGQTIGTVGTTATFEVADEPHLHFEILKDGEYVDPSIYLK